MNERSVVLVIYAAVLGWVAHAWWREEKERIAWNAADKALQAMAMAGPPPRQPAEPATGT